MSRTASDAAAAFADVVYADQQWVDAEFAELVASSFGEPPAPPPPAPPRVPPLPSIPSPQPRRPVQRATVLRCPTAGLAQGRQRSPPARLRAARPAAASGR